MYPAPVGLDPASCKTSITVICLVQEGAAHTGIRKSRIKHTFDFLRNVYVLVFCLHVSVPCNAYVWYLPEAGPGSPSALQMAVSCLMSMLGTELGSFAGAATQPQNHLSTPSFECLYEKEYMKHI